MPYPLLEVQMVYMRNRHVRMTPAMMRLLRSFILTAVFLIALLPA